VEHEYDFQNFITEIYQNLSIQFGAVERQTCLFLGDTFYVVAYLALALSVVLS